MIGIELNVIIIMLGRLIGFWFTRSRLRKGPTIDPKLKNLSSTHAIKKQIRQYRQEYETSELTQSFTDTLNTKKPVLKKRFKIDEMKLSKHLKKVVNRMMEPGKLIPASDKQDDLKFLNEGKSFLNDQKLEADFQEKFQKELFKRKQTERMVEKEDRNYKNFLPENQDNKYNSYIAAKTKLKNNRIDSMMNYRRNNEDLQLLIQSGFIDEPDNIKIIIDKINEKEGTKKIQHQQSKPSTETSMVHQDEKEGTEQNPLKGALMSNIEGPEQTKDFSKIQKFVERYEASSEQSKLKAAEDVDLLMKIKDYQRNLFLSRYDMINFRFKGRVDFDYFKEPQLLSYIKTQSIEPKDLLIIYDRNKERLNRFKLPIITPAVMSRIYSKTSTYTFPENDQNNHINMLNDPIFKALQSSLFRELDKISDELFCDAAWAYAKNHEIEKGLLNERKSNAIEKVIFTQTGERINRLKEVDLGLLMRSLIKLPLMKNEQMKDSWGEIVEALQHRLPLMTMDYQWQSVMQFLNLLPPSTTTINLMAQNLSFFKKYAWETRASLFAFARVGSGLIRNQHLIDPLEHNKTLMLMKQIAALKVEQIVKVLPLLNINEMGKTLVIFQELNKIPFGPVTPALIMNVAKKEIVDSIRMQKHKVYQNTVPAVLTALSAYDYFENILRKQSKYIDVDVLVKPYRNVNVLKYVPLKHMLPGRVFTFNSQLYFIYHELAKFLQVEEGMMTIRSLANSVFALSLVQYKNQGAFDTLAYRVLEKMEKEQAGRENTRLLPSEVVSLINIINAYSLQKRNVDLLEQICDKILIDGKLALTAVQLNILIRFFGSCMNIFPQSTAQPQRDSDSFSTSLLKWTRNKNINYAFLYCFKNCMSSFLQKLEVEELLTLYFVQTMIVNNVTRIIEVNKHLKEQFQQLLKQSKLNLQEMLKALRDVDEDKLKSDYRYVLALCLQLNRVDIHSVGNDEFGELEKLEKAFYDKHIQHILDHEQHVGVMYSYNQIYKKIGNKIRKSAKNRDLIKEKLWRIEDEEKKVVHFFTTFQHLMTKHSQDQTSFGLFGFWKIYSQLYRRKGWKFNLICTMLEQ